MRIKKPYAFFCFLFLIFGLISLLFLSATPVIAKCGDVPTAIINCDDENVENSIFGLLQTAIEIMSGIVGILAVIGLSVFGVQYLTAGGNEQKLTKAKRRLFEIIIGLIVYVILFSLLNWLTGNPPGERTSSQSSSWTPSKQSQQSSPQSSTKAAPTKANKTPAKKNKTYMGAPLEHYNIKNVTPNMIVSRAKTIINYAQKNGWKYGDSHGWPPGKDKLISCDRLASIVLYTLGFTNQPKGGYAINNGFFNFLKRIGFKESRSTKDIKKGSIVWLRYDPKEIVPTGAIGGHVFIVSSWNNKTNKFVRYDAGKNWNKPQPLITNGFPYQILHNNPSSYLKVYNLP